MLKAISKRSSPLPHQPSALLRVSALSIHFEGLKAIDGVDLTLERGEILGLIGPNGAGKTTFVNALSGFQRPTSGSIDVDGLDITRWSPDRRARHGVVRTFQSVRLFDGLTVWDNIAAASAVRNGRDSDQALSPQPLLELLDLTHRAHVLARSLPAGEARRLGIARALATGPAFLLLDEPAAGLNESESDQLVEILGGIRKSHGCALLVIEHDMRLIMRLCERLQVLDHGRTLAVGTADEIRRDPAVLTAYLGTAAGEGRA